MSLFPLFTFCARGIIKLFVAVTVAKIFALLLFYSGCDVGKLKKVRYGNVGKH